MAYDYYKNKRFKDLNLYLEYDIRKKASNVIEQYVQIEDIVERILRVATQSSNAQRKIKESMILIDSL